MKVLNLYAGIGGNRKLWTDCEVTAIEYKQDIANVYKDLFPNDTVIVGDAHEYLLKHFSEFDFIWASPPCQTHSITNHFLHAQGVIRYPDMKLYEEIIFLKHFFKGKWVVENVKSYYDPLIKPQISGRHYFWSNFIVPAINFKNQIGRMNGTKKTLSGLTTRLIRINGHKKLDFDLSNYNIKNKVKLLNNCVAPEIGLAIYNSARNIVNKKPSIQTELIL